MNDNEIEVKISGESAGAKSAMEAAATAVKTGVAQMNEHLSGLGEAFELIKGKFEMVAALLGGGTLFKEGIDATKELTRETRSLSMAMGIGMEDASALNVALKSTGNSADVYTSANARLTRQIRANEKAVQKMGVQTRGANGELLNAQTIMTNAIEALKGYKEGTDRNLASQQLFGRGAAETTELLRLNSKVMDEAKERAQALGLVIGPEQEARTFAYKEGMEQVELVLKALENQIGEALMPVLTEMAEWFSSVGPGLVQTFKVAFEAVADVMNIVIEVAVELYHDVMDVFTSIGETITAVAGDDIPGALQIWKNAMVIIEVAVLSLKAGLVLAFEVIRGAILVVVEEIKGWAAIAQAAFRMDWAGVKAAWSAGTAAVEKVIEESQHRILEKTAETAAQMQRLLTGQPATAGGPVPTETGRVAGTRNYVNPKTPADKNTDRLKAEFALMKAQLQAELALQTEYLAEAQQDYDYAYKHNLITTDQFYASKLAIERQSKADSIATKEQEIAQTIALEAKAIKPADKLALEAQRVALQGQMNVLVAQEAELGLKIGRENQDANNQRIRALQEIQRISTQQAGVNALDLERVQLDQKLALHEITNAQLLQAEKDLQDRAYQIDLAAAQARYALADNDPKVIAQIDAEILAIHQKHALDMAKIDKDIVVEAQKDTLTAQDAIEQGVTNFMATIGDSTKSFHDKFMSLIGTIEQALMQLAAKNLMKGILGDMSGSGGGGGGNWLSSLLGSIMKYDVGTSYVPNDGLAMIHKGERIVTAKDNASGNYGAGNGSGPVSVTVNVPPSTSTLTAQQIALRTGQAVQVAMRRNG